MPSVNSSSNSSIILFLFFNFLGHGQTSNEVSVHWCPHPLITPMLLLAMECLLLYSHQGTLWSLWRTENLGLLILVAWIKGEDCLYMIIKSGVQNCYVVAIVKENRQEVKPRQTDFLWWIRVLLLFQSVIALWQVSQKNNFITLVVDLSKQTAYLCNLVQIFLARPLCSISFEQRMKEISHHYESPSTVPKYISLITTSLT